MFPQPEQLVPASCCWPEEMLVCSTLHLLPSIDKSAAQTLLLTFQVLPHCMCEYSLVVACWSRVPLVSAFLLGWQGQNTTILTRQRSFSFFAEDVDAKNLSGYQEHHWTRVHCYIDPRKTNCVTLKADAVGTLCEMEMSLNSVHYKQTAWNKVFAWERPSPLRTHVGLGLDLYFSVSLLWEFEFDQNHIFWLSCLLNPL